LWTDIQINLSKSAEDLLDLYLHRSKICLLDIRLTQTPQHHGLDLGEYFYKEKFKRYLRLLVRHAARWRTFVIENVTIGPLSRALSSLSEISVP
jgi:hypothetical protein